MRSAKEDERYANAMPKKWQRNYKEDTKKGPMQCQSSAKRSDKEKRKKQLKKYHCNVKEVTNKCKINSGEVQKSAGWVTKKWQRN